MPNHLSRELSPYLLQHAGNPVDWRPWDGESLALARRTQRPIFLSVGYASCHWCHVMAHESFEHAGIARLLNEHFVSIKVDREERPDLDMLYMEAVQMMTGRGGWPMSVFLTPEGEAFFGGTYWPPTARGGMAGFDEVLWSVADAWEHRREELIEQAGQITQLLREGDRRVREAQQAAGEKGTGPICAQHPAGGHQPKVGRGKLDQSSFPHGAFHAPHEAALRGSFDPRYGGFGAAPKFPQPLALRWLLRRWRQTGDNELLRMTTTTLDRMAAGGMFDQLGGGFHRYSVDAAWLVPHFEKMLYDNAMLAACYLEAWQATGCESYATVVRQTLDYLLRDMADPAGGFHSSEDADSEGEEGKSYLWTPGEVAAILGSEAAAVFCRVYDVTEAGNFEGRNILSLPRPLAIEAKMLGRDEGELAAEMDAARRKLLAARAWRIRPGRDDKVIVSWNGLAIESLARAGATLQEPRYAAAADAAADFLLANLYTVPFFPDDGRLRHYWRAGQAKCDAYLDDYAALGNALLTLYETTSDRRRLDQAVGVADRLLASFADREHGGFFYTADDHERLIARKKDAIDNPLPSGNGLAATLLVRLAAICGRADYAAAADATLRACLPWMRLAPTGTFELLLAADLSGA